MKPLISRRRRRLIGRSIIATGNEQQGERKKKSCLHVLSGFAKAAAKNSFDHGTTTLFIIKRLQSSEQSERVICSQGQGLTTLARETLVVNLP